jgi:hypothetical protein
MEKEAIKMQYFKRNCEENGYSGIKIISDKSIFSNIRNVFSFKTNKLLLLMQKEFIIFYFFLSRKHNSSE